MPFISEKVKLSVKYDRRRKLSEDDKSDIVTLYGQGVSMRQLARIYQVSRRLVQFIVFPERHAENLRLRKERGGSTAYYDRKRHTKSVREHRRYKETLFKGGLIA